MPTQTASIAAVRPTPALPTARLGVLVALLMRAMHPLRFARPPADEDAAQPEDGAQAFKRSSYLQQVRALERLSHQRELDLFETARSMHADAAEREAARREIVRANLWVVPVIVRRYCHGGSGFDDLVAEGNMGLYAAFDRFDPGRGFRFSTYAKWWIVDAVTAAMSANAYPLRVPRRTALALARQSSRDTAHAADDAAPLLPVLRVETLDDDDVAGQDGGAAHDLAPTPEQLVALRQALQLLVSAVNELPARERRVIEGRYGLNGRTEQTLQDIGTELGVTAERVRTLQLSAVAMLRRSFSA